MASSTELQRRIFSRWVNQKVFLPKGIQCNDIVDDIGDGILLIQLMEVLTDASFPEKYNKKPKMRVHKIDNLNKALKFVWDSGVQIKVKPSPEDLADGVERQVLGLIWGIMLKFMKFGDDEDSLNAKDALLLWIQNKTASYSNLKVENFKKNFKDGLALCALIHKHRPNLVDYDSLAPGDDANIQVAFDAAEKYFQLEPYLTPADFKNLDENSMVVYAAEYYYGIAEQRKVDLAVRRIGKLVTLTEENDQMRAEHNAGALKLKEHMTSVEKILSDRTIDNNMAGAKRRIAEFYEYKTKDKGIILGDQLQLEALFNNLAMRLAHHKRPEYVPPEGCTLKDVEAAVTHLEECEQERNVALHQELNRQIKLVRWDNQHEQSFQKLQAWIAEKEAYLNTKEVIESVGAAMYELSKLDAYDSEATQVNDSTVAALTQLGDDLEKEVYENLDTIRGREAEIAASQQRLAELSNKKRPVLQDDLAREQFREGLRLQNQEHIDISNNLQAWVADKEAYLNTKESINSVAEAQTQISLLESYEAEKVMMAESSVAQLKDLGEETKAAKYETEYSSAACETTAEIDERHAAIDAKWVSLSELSAAKKAVLDDDLAREQFKANLRLLNAAHLDRHNKIQKWVGEKEAYLNTKETVTSVAEAQTQLSLLESYEKEKAIYTDSSVAALKTLGQEILTAKYETEHSSAAWESPEEVNDREAAVAQKWESLSTLSAAKKEVLEDDLAREQFNDKLRMWNRNHTTQTQILQSWIAEKEAYLNTKEEVDNVAEAMKQLSLLDQYDKEAASQWATSVVVLKQLGNDILTAKYETKHSSSQWNTPEEIKEREAGIDAKGEELGKLSAAKREVLDDDLAREQFRDKLRSWNYNHTSQQNKIKEWVAKKTEYLNTREEIDTVSGAQVQIKLLAAYGKDKELKTNNNVAKLKQLGAEILGAKYETKHSSAAWETPDEIKQREQEIDDSWATLTQLFDTKKTWLDSELAREEKKEELRLKFANMAGTYSRYVKDTSERAAASQFGFDLPEVEAYKEVLDKDDASIASSSDESVAAFTAVFNEAKDLGVKENVYTSANLDTLAAEKASLDEAISKRRSAYDAELAVQQENDALCKKFAGVADPFSKWITEQKDTITNAKGELEAQLAYVEERLSGMQADSARLEEAKGIQAEIDAKNITNNRHTLLSAKDLEVQWGQYEGFLNKKKTMLEEAIEHHKLRGITPDQYKEIEENFALFDKENKGHLAPKELKTCLYSLGEERGKNEIEGIVKEYGDGNGVNYDGFKEFMITLLGDTDTKEEIVDSFKLINRGDVATEERMNVVSMPEHTQEYIKKTAPAVEGGWDYVAWTEDVFSR